MHRVIVFLALISTLVAATDVLNSRPLLYRPPSTPPLRPIDLDAPAAIPPPADPTLWPDDTPNNPNPSQGCLDTITHYRAFLHAASHLPTAPAPLEWDTGLANQCRDLVVADASACTAHVLPAEGFFARGFRGLAQNLFQGFERCDAPQYNACNGVVETRSAVWWWGEAERALGCWPEQNQGHYNNLADSETNRVGCYGGKNREGVECLCCNFGKI
ncbi:hypothetical protein HDU96_010598 [Phlyctochytrium bullatum]|nr:hypothetical protein HDU96_010598 [Phlyctochytrium bullatum]